ncbi:hypothetical protein LRAMOSA02728 [Lichtheimia ramosa]|uniref:Sugar phosphate transporter domain-containing protein n=1 Tax=Lichtheimia ramosa TaxID=688394 RepID=A0A077WR27_9FUNG|nr:hypothetical protein LRAMOSA02728 [Lichtheimia ramosa]
MPAATMVSQGPAIIVPDASSDNTFNHHQHNNNNFVAKRKNSLSSSSFELDTRSPTSPNHYFKQQLYNRNSGNGFSDAPQSLPTPPLPASEEYSYPPPSMQTHQQQPSPPSSTGFPSSAFKDHDLESDLSTRHVDSTQANPLQNLVNLVLPHQFSLSDNLKFILNCCMWYSSSSLTNNTGKQILNVFRYPVTLTFVQFGLVALFCYMAAVLFKITDIRRPTHRIASTMSPLAGFLIVGHVFSSIAISRVPVSLVHTIKALAPLFTVMFYRFIFNVKYSSSVYVSLLPLTLGVILACTFTFSNNLIGLICAFLSCLVFVTQNIFSKKLLFKESNLGKGDPNKLDKMNMLFYSSLLSFVLMSPLWLYSDGGRLLFSEQEQRDVSTTQLIMYFLLNGITNFSQNWFAFTTLSMTSPVTYSIASLVKRIFVIVMSIIWFGQVVSFAQWIGILLTFVGLWMYQSAKRDVDRGESRIREKSLDVLPTSSSATTDVGNESSLQSWIAGRWNAVTAGRDTKIH